MIYAWLKYIYYEIIRETCIIKSVVSISINCRPVLRPTFSACRFLQKQIGFSFLVRPNRKLPATVHSRLSGHHACAAVLYTVEPAERREEYFLQHEWQKSYAYVRLCAVRREYSTVRRTVQYTTAGTAASRDALPASHIRQSHEGLETTTSLFIDVHDN